VPHDFQSDIDAVGRIGAVPNILDVVCRITGMGFAAVARVTEDRWIACSVLDKINFGLTPGGELKVATTICNEIRESGEAVIIDHVATDAVYCDHPTPAMYGFQSYISMPIIRQDGSFFGTLCAIDPHPAKLKTPETIGMFKLFAELVATQLDAEARVEESERMAELRDQFIAVLGHDLRNPIAALSAGAKMLARTPLDIKALEIVTLMQSSVVRMNGLVDNLLDFARGRLGGGITLDRRATDLAPVLEQVIDELRAVNPQRSIDALIDLPIAINVDPDRVAQLFSNLLANALNHGASDRPVMIDANSTGGVFELTVANAGDPIPPEQMSQLFLPFARGKKAAGHMGLGLGLYIASEIARAHGGTVAVSSTADETRFTLSIPN
jgi:signal transduction histidine kinase